MNGIYLQKIQRTAFGPNLTGSFQQFPKRFSHSLASVQPKTFFGNLNSIFFPRSLAIFSVKNNDWLILNQFFFCRPCLKIRFDGKLTMSTIKSNIDTTFAWFSILFPFFKTKESFYSLVTITNNEEEKNWIDFIRRYSVIVTSLAPFHIDLRTVNAHNATETKK